MGLPERAFFTEENAQRDATLNCPFCRTASKHSLRWLLRRKKDRLPHNADYDDRARFAKLQSYMVLIDDYAVCPELGCRRRFEITSMKTMAFL
jgi:hypothetical protein